MNELGEGRVKREGNGIEMFLIHLVDYARLREIREALVWRTVNRDYILCIDFSLFEC